jgi:hypothetical protein
MSERRRLPLAASGKKGVRLFEHCRSHSSKMIDRAASDTSFVARDPCRVPLRLLTHVQQQKHDCHATDRPAVFHSEPCGA